ncbi:RNA-binding protein 42-like [Dendronephthya gigantea]|uniref:RNA-binding protein 42-like n=1 Tax=Dendronephthya gigantea TaxID=151771 RepID=UPI001069EB21|nr:RNA-binding protein 42-like [Dendronephthya gigantea]
MQNSRPNDVQARELEDEMSRFEEEISGHTIERPIIGTGTFRQASRTIHDVHSIGQQDSHPNRFGHFPNNDPAHGGHFLSGSNPDGIPPRGRGMPRGGFMHGRMPPRGNNPQGMPSTNHDMPTQNNMAFNQPSQQQFSVQQVPFPIPPMPPQIPAQFHPRMQQNVMSGIVPMVPMQVPGTVKVPTEHVGITPEQKKEWESAYAKQESGGGKAKKKDKKFVRVAGGVVWEDTSLADWDPNDFRIFVGDIGNEVTDEALTRAFAKYPSFQKAKVIRERKTNKTKGYGFVSFKESSDFIKAMREMNGKYVGNRPIKLRKSTWKDRSIDVVKKKVKEKKKLGLR